MSKIKQCKRKTCIPQRLQSLGKCKQGRVQPTPRTLRPCPLRFFWRSGVFTAFRVATKKCEKCERPLSRVSVWRLRCGIMLEHASSTWPTPAKEDLPFLQI